MEHAITAFAAPHGALNFGERIRISGDANLIVTSHSVSTSAAVISVFRRSGGSPIVLRHSAIPYPTAIALSADGMTLVAGDSTNNAAVVFGRTVTGVSTEGRVLTTPSERRGFGTGVSVSANGSVVVVGDQYVDAGAGPIHTFMRTGSTITASWSAPTTLTRHAGAQVIGHSIVMDGDARTLVIPDFQAGAVWMYAR